MVDEKTPKWRIYSSASNDGAKKPNARMSQKRLQSLFAKKYGHLVFVLPGLVFFLAVMVGPTLFAFVVSLTDWSGRGSDYNFIGLQNFVEALGHWPLYRAAINNLILFAAMLVFQHTIGLFVAVQLNEKPKFMEIYRAVLFMPVIISLVSTGFIWTLMLSSNIGFINPVLRDLGLGFLATGWLSNPATALPTVIAVTAWNSIGWAIIIYVSGLQNVPEELKQAAQIDGANGWQTFWRVIFPHLSPAFTALSVLTFIGTFKTFDLVYVLTGPIGSPNFRTDVLGTLIYRTAFGGAGNYTDDTSMSFAIALALIVFIFMTIIAWVMIKVLRRREIQS
jgi:raffinose/stachyose/melibiose transport system permease protein